MKYQVHTPERVQSHGQPHGNNFSAQKTSNPRTNQHGGAHNPVWASGPSEILRYFTCSGSLVQDRVFESLRNFRKGRFKFLGSRAVAIPTLLCNSFSGLFWKEHGASCHKGGNWRPICELVPPVSVLRYFRSLLSLPMYPFIRPLSLKCRFTSSRRA